MEHKNKTPQSVAPQELNVDIPISKDIPPTLVVHAEDANINPIRYSEVYVRELNRAGFLLGANGTGKVTTHSGSARPESTQINGLKPR